MTPSDSSTPTAAETLLARAATVVPGGVHSGRRSTNPPFCISRASGAYVFDLDGRRYIDNHAAFGAIILGHADEEVNARAAEAARSGTLFGIGTTEDEMTLASKIVSHVPSIDQVLFCNSGSEATLYAIRLARAVTGRELILKCQGHYHGHHDYVLRNIHTTPREKLGKRDPNSAGMLPAAVDATLVARYNDLSDVDRVLRENPNRVAGIIVEPIAHNGPGILPLPGFLEGLRSLADQHGALLIFDEVISGYRHGLGGYQAIAGVTPDLTTLGKALANGYPLAALGGRRDLMERFNTHASGDVVWAGTYNSNAVVIAAALATLDRLEDPAIYAHLYRLGNTLRDGLRDLAGTFDVPLTVSGFGSLFCLTFQEGPITSYDDVILNDSITFVRYRRAMIARGVFQFPDLDGLRCHLTASHSSDDVRRILDVSAEALKATLTH